MWFRNELSSLAEVSLYVYVHHTLGLAWRVLYCVWTILDMLFFCLPLHFLFIRLYCPSYYHLRHPQKEQQRNFYHYMVRPAPFQLTSHLVTPSLYYVSISPLSFVLMHHNHTWVGKITLQCCYSLRLPSRKSVIWWNLYSYSAIWVSD